MAVANVSNNYIKSIINKSLIREESEEVSLGGYTFYYPECQFVVTVKGVYEPVIKKSIKGEIYFETESLKISDHPQDSGAKLIVKNKTNSDLSYSIQILPWIDSFSDQIKKVKEEFDIFNSSLLQKLYPALEFVPTNIPVAFTHNLSKDVSELTISIVDYSTDTILSRPIFGKFTDGEFSSDLIVIRKNSANPKNSIDVEFKGNKKPKNCSLRLEGKTLFVELLDYTQRSYIKTNKNLEQNNSDNINHNLDLDVIALPVKLKIEYTMNGRNVPVPGNRPKDLKFINTPQAKFVYAFTEGHLIDEGNLNILIDKQSPKNILIITNNINMLANGFKNLGYNIEVTQFNIILTLNIELN